MAINSIDTVQLDMLRYPIGQYTAPDEITSLELQAYLQDIELLPAQMRQAVENLSDEQLDTPYRPGGWTVRQVVHHVADSHMNSYIRFKLALTEENPTIKPYEEHLWAELPDSKEPVEVSLVLLEAVHYRWIKILRALTSDQWQKSFHHPASGKTILIKAAGIYAWHGKHHLAHITHLRALHNW
ncbi:YfiT family bacillithiol transferase [Adhaeribacter aquaticus]|uniref:YfiT family bacillithiol transferase n=1 Tax=Adhaeribacter aquaticus TaxID=299567 RepID=UPI0003FE2F70|nr:bacillithiol transferase BstA [Adhaeribacter aquaticus]